MKCSISWVVYWRSFRHSRKRVMRNNGQLWCQWRTRCCFFHGTSLCDILLSMGYRFGWLGVTVRSGCIECVTLMMVVCQWCTWCSFLVFSNRSYCPCCYQWSTACTYYIIYNNNVNTLYVKLLVMQQFSNNVFTSNGSRHVYGAASLHSRPADVVQKRIFMCTENSLLMMRVAINTFEFCFLLSHEKSGLMHCIVTGPTALSLKLWCY